MDIDGNSGRFYLLQDGQQFLYLRMVHMWTDEKNIVRRICNILYKILIECLPIVNPADGIFLISKTNLITQVRIHL